MANTIRRLQKNIKQKDGSFITEHYETDATIVEYDSANSGLGCTNAQEAIDKLADYQNNLQIGGRNLAKETNQGSKNWGWSLGTGSVTVESETIDSINCVKLTKTQDVSASGWNYVYYKNFERNKIKPSTEYILSFEVKSNKISNIDAHLTLLTAKDYLTETCKVIKGKVEGNDTWTKVVFLLKTYSELPTSTGQVIYLRGFNPENGAIHYIRNLMLEEGTKPTDWTPAPEDITPSYIGAINVNKITDRLDVTEDGFVLGGKAGKALQDQIIDVENSITNMQIGGRNLLVQNTKTTGCYLNSSGEAIMINGWCYSDYIEVTPNTQIIASGYSNLGTAPSTCFYDSNKTFVSGVANDNYVANATEETMKKDKRRLVTVPSGCSYMRFSFMYKDTKIMLEKGNKSSFDFTPSPEDIQTQIDNKLDKTGGTVTDRLYLQKGFNVVTHSGSTGNGAGLSGYVSIAQLKILKNYSDSPIEIKVSQRCNSETTTLMLLFESSSARDPNIASFRYRGRSIDAYLHKSDVSTWDLYVRKTGGYDSVTIVDINMDMSYQDGRIDITYPGQFVETLPSDAIKATFYNQASTSLVANQSPLLTQVLQRPTDANIEIGKYNGISTMLATSKMTSNKPDSMGSQDSIILNLGWDTDANWGSQLAVGISSNPHMAIRGSSPSGWDTKWTHILDDNNYLKYINSLGGVDLANQTISLNDLTLSDNSAKVRYYYCSLDGTGANITGRPDDSHKNSFLLKVELFRYFSSKEYRTIQTYISSYDYKTYKRFCNNGTWSGWVCELDSGNFKSYVTPSSIGAINKPTQKSLTIPNTGWVDEVHGNYLKKLVLSVDGITESMIVNLNIALESDEVAVDCGFASINKSGNGTLTFYAESVPSASINATYYVLN